MNNYAEYIGYYHLTQPMLSISMEGCMESGKDCTAGGCKYNGYGGTATGLATLADSLSTIKYMCFDKKLLTTKELYDAWLANWEGFEPLRQRILNEVPHYGNADPYVDQELKWCVDLYYQICSECYSVRARRYGAGLYGASDHIAQGWFTFATPDGRRTGEPLADAMCAGAVEGFQRPDSRIRLLLLLRPSAVLGRHRAQSQDAPDGPLPRRRRRQAAGHDEGVI
jgi:formate C-acetyltransferase